MKHNSNKFFVAAAIILAILSCTSLNERQQRTQEIVKGYIYHHEYGKTERNHNSRENRNTTYFWEYYSLIDIPVREARTTGLDVTQYCWIGGTPNAALFRNDTTLFVGIKWYYKDIKMVVRMFHYDIAKVKVDSTKNVCYFDVVERTCTNSHGEIVSCGGKKKKKSWWKFW